MHPVEERSVGALRVQVHPDGQALARAAAALTAAHLRAAVAARGVAHAMFATGNSQLPFIESLVTATEAVPWADTVVWHMDEYLGIGPDHPASFRRWTQQRIVDRVHPAGAHLLDGLAEPTGECARYAGLLGAHPLDLCCLGIGENGHLAFNDPPVADFDDPADVKVVTLDGACRRQQVDEGHFATVGDVPTQALTVTVPALLRARRVLAVVPDARKAAPVRAALEGPRTTDCPASALRGSGNATLLLDRASAGLLAPA